MAVLYNGIQLIDGTDSGFTETAYTDAGTLFLIRTDSGGTDGYARINGKDYMTIKSHFVTTYSGRTYSAEDIAQTYENIGWSDQTTNVIVSGLPTSTTAVTLTAVCDGDTTILSGNTGYTTTFYKYCPYTIEAPDISGYTTPDKIEATAMRGETVTHIMTYVDEDDDDE